MSQCYARKEPPPCPLSTPKCPLLAKTTDKCAVSKLVSNLTEEGGENEANREEKCVIAPSGCSCVPNPPCPLAQLDKATEKKTSKPDCPIKYPTYPGQCETKSSEPPFSSIRNTCPNALKGRCSIDENDTNNNADGKRKSRKKSKKSDQTLGSAEDEDELLEVNAKKKDKPVKKPVPKRSMNIPDCTLASPRPLPCSKCLDVILKGIDINSSKKDCKYFKITNMCDKNCLCENVAQIDPGPPCPFGAKPCPCCEAIRCPLSRKPDCPIIGRDPQKSVKPPTCKCYCPAVPPPCTLGMPPLCKMHNNVCNPPPCPLIPSKCKCNCPPKPPCCPPPSPSCPPPPSLRPPSPLPPCPPPPCCCSPNDLNIFFARIEEPPCSCAFPLNPSPPCCPPPPCPPPPCCPPKPCPPPPHCPPSPCPPPKCECNSKKGECPLTPLPFSSCPMKNQPVNQPCKEPPPPPLPPLCPEKPNKPTLLVPPNLLGSIEQTLTDLNVFCTCVEPPPPQEVTMIPTTSLPSQSSAPPPCVLCPSPTPCGTMEETSKKTQQPPCAAMGAEDECPIECPCEIPRTFHVPTCPKKNPACMREYPKAEKEGELVCPFYPRGCPLGPTCPYPVPAKALSKKENEKTVDPATKKRSGKSSTKGVAQQKKADNTKGAPQQKGADNTTLQLSKASFKEAAESLYSEISASKGKPKKKDVPAPGMKCPLSDLPGAKKKTCPFAPGPCPLDPIKPLAICEPKPCPFAPKPPCPLMPKPLCPPTPKCLMKPLPPMPKCPNAPPGCPLAPTKRCFEEDVNYDCPCPKPKPCCCCPCPPLDPCCPNPCPPPNPCCCPPKPCPPPDPCCCPSKPDPSSPPKTCSICVDCTTDSGCKCSNCCEVSCPPALECPLTKKPKYPIAPKDTQCPMKNDLRVSQPSNTCSCNAEIQYEVAESSTSIMSNGKCSCLPKPGGSGSCPKASKLNEGCPCPDDGGVSCSCSQLPFPPQTCFCCPCDKIPPCLKKPITQDVVDTIITKLKGANKEENKAKQMEDDECAVKIPPCEKFPEGRCPMEDLGLCDCPYPCPPCLEPPKCGNSRIAPPQYCTAPKCCMGLGLPPVVEKTDLDKIGPKIYYKHVPTKPGKEETKYKVEILDHPPVEFPFGPPTPRKNPQWHIIKYGTAFETCSRISEKYKKEQVADSEAQFNPRDNPMDPETKLILENKKNQEIMDQGDKVGLKK